MTRGPQICFILKGYPRISETFISREILGLEQLGFSIRIISMRRPREEFCHDHIRRIRARVDYLPSSILAHTGTLVCHNLALAVKKPGAYLDALKRAFVRWRRTRKSATFKHLLQAGYLVNHLLPPGTTARFHAHFAHSPTSVAFFAGILSGRPFSFFAHAKDIYTQDTRQLREKIHRAAFVVTCTQYNRRYLTDISKGLGTPVDCVYHGIDPDYFSGPCPQKSFGPPFNILTVARHVPKKGLDIVIRAMGILQDQGIDFFHTIIGDGDLKSVHHALIRSLGLGDRIQILGNMPQNLLVPHYARSHLFILGCRIAGNGDRDGIPNVLAESMAMGVPCVAPRVSGIPELLEHGKTGFLVPPKDPAALAGAARSLLTNPDRATQMAGAARQRVRQVFDRRQLITDLAALYLKRMEETQ